MLRSAILLAPGGYGQFGDEEIAEMAGAVFGHSLTSRASDRSDYGSQARWPYRQRDDDPEVAAKLRIEERELEGVGRLN